MNAPVQPNQQRENDILAAEHVLKVLAPFGISGNCLGRKSESEAHFLEDCRHVSRWVAGEVRLFHVDEHIKRVTHCQDRETCAGGEGRGTAAVQFQCSFHGPSSNPKNTAAVECGAGGTNGEGEEGDEGGGGGGEGEESAATRAGEHNGRKVER